MRQTEVPGVVEVLKREGPVGREPVGGDVFAGVENPHAIMAAVGMAAAADAGVDEEVGLVGEFDRPAGV